MCKVAVMGRAVLNTEWYCARLGTKNRIPARHCPGGFVMVATEQSNVLGLEPFVFTRVGKDAAGRDSST